MLLEEAINLLEKLSNAFGPPGHEDEVREIVRKELEEVVDEVKIDALGNIICVKHGKSNYPVILLDAHMDEVGLLITHIDKNGFLYFGPLGGFDPRILYGQKVIIKGSRGHITGYIGAKAPHLVKPEETKQTIPLEQLFIDIGASSKEEVIDLGIDIGSVATFGTKFVRLGKNRVLGKAFDDRAGLTVMISVVKALSDSEYNIIAVGAAQEEVGLRGARTAAWQVKADFALALEGTAAADTPGTPENLTSTSLGAGPAITIADRSLIAHPKIVKVLIEAAKQRNIPYQFKRVIAGGTDAGVIHLTREGIPAGVVSVPSRYIHSPAAILDLRDLENAIKLTIGFIEDISKMHGK